jgi:hypothetical protein
LGWSIVEQDPDRVGIRRPETEGAGHHSLSQVSGHRFRETHPIREERIIESHILEEILPVGKETKERIIESYSVREILVVRE